MWNFYAAIRAAFDLKRTCPKCHKDQVIKSEFRHKVVNCKYCGTQIPVPSKHKRYSHKS